MGPHLPPSLTLRRITAEPVEALAKTGRGDDRKPSAHAPLPDRSDAPSFTKLLLRPIANWSQPR